MRRIDHGQRDAGDDAMRRKGISGFMLVISDGHPELPARGGGASRHRAGRGRCHRLQACGGTGADVPHSRSAFAADVWNSMFDDGLLTKGPWPSLRLSACHMRQGGGT